MPQGSAAVEYQVFLCVEIQDKYHAASTFFFNATVSTNTDTDWAMALGEQAVLNSTQLGATDGNENQGIFQASNALMSVLNDEVSIEI